MSQISPLLLLRNGIAAAKTGDRVQARQVLKRVTELDPNNELAWLWLASVAESLLDARQYLRRVVEINPGNAQAIKGLEIVEAKLAQEAMRRQCPFCQAVIGQNDSCPRCHAILSLQHIDRLLSHSPVNETALRGAVTIFQAGVRANDNDFNAHYNLGLAFLNLNKLDQGLYHLQKAQQIHPDDLDFKRQVDLLVQRQAATVSQAKPNAISQKKILVVDDSPTICKLVTITLEKHGYRVVCAPDGLEGLSKLNDTQPNLILLDITMPRMDGYQLCRIVKGNPETENIPVIMLSGKDGFFDKVRGRAAGATDYITKPFEPNILVQTVQKYLDADALLHVNDPLNKDQSPALGSAI